MLPVLLAGARTPQAAVQRFVFSHVAITGSRATLQASYDANGSLIRERYSLARSGGIWLITGARQL